MRLISFALAVVGLAFSMLTTPAEGAKRGLRKWKFAGAVTGGYSIGYQIDHGRCLDSRNESGSGVRLTVRGGLTYDNRERTIRTIRDPLVSVDAGQATFSGTETVINPDNTCNTPQPYNCTGQVAGLSEKGKERARGEAVQGELRLPLFIRGKWVGRIGGNTSVVVRGGGGGPPSTPCVDMAGKFGARGSFGPAVNAALASFLEIPRAKLATGRKFVLVGIPEKERGLGCDVDDILGCTHHQTLGLSLTFTPGKLVTHKKGTIGRAGSS